MIEAMTWSSLASPAVTLSTSLSCTTKGLSNNSVVVLASIDLALNTLNTVEDASVNVTVNVHADPASLHANKLLTIAAVALGTVYKVVMSVVVKSTFY